MSFENQVNSDRRIIGIPVIGNPSALTPNLQFDSAQNAFVWVAASSASLSELEFLQGKDAAGKLRIVTGTTAAAVSIVTITPPNGTTTVIYKVSILVVGTTADTIANLRINGVTIETIRLNNGAINSNGNTYFITKGKQLVGDGVKTIDVNLPTNGGTMYCTIEAYDL